MAGPTEKPRKPNVFKRAVLPILVVCTFIPASGYGVYQVAHNFPLEEFLAPLGIPINAGFAYLSVAIAAALIMVTKIPVIAAQGLQGQRGLDNSNPRGQQEQLTGWGKRAVAAHQNTIEAFPVFAAGVIIATPYANILIVSRLCIMFLASRIVYPVLYLADLASLRSLVWSVGFLSSMALLFLVNPWWIQQL
eukprot:TRINITY_DN1498_c0_g1_i1.p2 TRINITY_DN1498_c0_g1~~TRINITY_DN1498_c0_g1_i1.p2  ORF type:complete len:192 (+),score=36.08 TRINITY_DN1498_c0_g1_i1:71-646(+)